MQWIASVQETPDSASKWSTRSTCHLKPFHDMAKLPTSARCPTAMQLAALVHEMPFRVVKGVAGAPSGVQTLPFHDSAAVPPTAMQLAAEAQEIADDTPGGAGSTVHAAPFQDSPRSPGAAMPTTAQPPDLTQARPAHIHPLQPHAATP